MARIPIVAAKAVGVNFDFDQVIIIARNSQTGMQHVTTWGKTRQLCDDTAQVGNDVKRYLGWPETAIKAKKR